MKGFGMSHSKTGWLCNAERKKDAFQQCDAEARTDAFYQMV
jgi:hypothetical protein